MRKNYNESEKGSTSKDWVNPSQAACPPRREGVGVLRGWRWCPRWFSVFVCNGETGEAGEEDGERQLHGHQSGRNRVCSSWGHVEGDIPCVTRRWVSTVKHESVGRTSRKYAKRQNQWNIGGWEWTRITRWTKTLLELEAEIERGHRLPSVGPCVAETATIPMIF